MNEWFYYHRNLLKGSLVRDLSNALLLLSEPLSKASIMCSSGTLTILRTALPPNSFFFVGRKGCRLVPISSVQFGDVVLWQGNRRVYQRATPWFWVTNSSIHLHRKDFSGLEGGSLHLYRLGLTLIQTSKT